MDTLIIAKVCHAAMQAYNDARGEVTLAFELVKDSTVAGVDEALRGATPEQLHKSWLKAKEADGWKYGPVKDAAIKTHPCMVPYADLPEDQQKKDALFQGIVLALGVKGTTAPAHGTPITVAFGTPPPSAAPTTLTPETVPPSATDAAPVQNSQPVTPAGASDNTAAPATTNSGSSEGAGSQ